jgi:nicotinate-nucleotide adenylyltransferase
MKIGIFGGTFNPIHIGHLRVALEVKEKLTLGKVIFVPSHMPPHKNLANNIPGKKRLQMIQMAIKGNPFFEASDFEVKKETTSYSIKTIRFIGNEYKTTPYFILGQDAFNEISTWFEADKLFDYAHFVVMTRPDADKVPLNKVLGKKAKQFKPIETGYKNNKNNEIIFAEVSSLDISSSHIRDLCKKRQSIKYLTPKEVEEYILRERLYQ